MEERYLFQSGMADLRAIKNSFTGNTLPLIHLQLPFPFLSLQCARFLKDICLFVSVHAIGMGCDSMPLSLFVQFVFPFILCLHPSLASLCKNLAWNRDRRAPAVFLTHSSFLKSKSTEVKSGYYLSRVYSLTHPSIFAQGL